MNNDCQSFDVFLGRVPGSGTDRIDLDAFAEHISGCPRCRGLLIAFVAKETNGLLTTTPLGRHVDAEEMAAFVDTERLYGTLAAASEQPDVWLHIITCSHCAEMVQELTTLEWIDPAHAYTTPELAALVDEEPVFLVGPQQLHAHMDALRQHGMVWRQGITNLRMLGEVETDGVWVTLWLRYMGDTGIAFVIHTDPPQPGTAHVQVNDQTFTQTFTFDGEATFPTVNERVLTTLVRPLRFFIKKEISQHK